jgi:hypothetical protein
MADTFKAATWNVYYGTPLAELEPILQDLLADGVSLFLIQEGSQRGLPAMLKRNGLSSYRVYPQYVIAWTDEWVDVALKGVRLSQTSYFRKGGKKPIPTEGAFAILSDREGRTLTALSYHTPAHVQVRPENRPPRRFQALREAMETMKTLADLAETRAVLFGGDDNVDEARAFRADFRFMLRAATGLRQVVAPRPTHGHRTRGRRIDDFRVRGLKPGRGYVRDGGGDHRVHVREFHWKD